jgi:Na+/H+ antiporter
VSTAFATLAVSGVIAVVIAAFLRQWGWSMSLPLIGAGMLLGLVPFGPNGVPDPEIILVAVLAPLVFGEALGSSYLDLRKVARPVLVLAIGLVVFSTLAIGFVGYAVAALPIAVAMALGAVLAPTDAVSVSTIAKRAGLPRRLVSILEGESLVNDGTGLTALKVATVAAVAGSITLVDVALDFSLAIFVGIGVGLFSGAVMARLLRRSQDLVPANSLIIVAPFLIYIGAEAAEGSGILAIVVAGLFVAHRQNSEPGASGRVQSAVVWRHLTFILQALAFFLIGLEIPEVLGRLDNAEIRQVALLVVSVVITLIAARVLFVFGMVGVMRLTNRKQLASRNGSLLRESAIVSWAGARGPISGLAALSIPLVTATGDPFPARDAILATSFVIIVITLILAETLGPLARRLRIPPDDDREEIARVQGSLATAALIRMDTALEELAQAGTPMNTESAEVLRRDMEMRLRRSSSTGQEAEQPVTAELEISQMLNVAISMVHAEQEELIRMRDSDGLPDAIARPLLRELDSREQALVRQIR